jgi:serine protease Do
MENNISSPETSISGAPENQSSSQKPKKGGLIVLVIIVSILFSSAFGAVFGFMAGGLGQKVFSGKLSQIFSRSMMGGKFNQETTNQSVIQEDSAIIDVVDKATPAVVSIVISKDVPRVKSFFSNPFDSPNFFDPFGSGNGSGQDQGGTQKQQIGGGSGFIITSDGMVVTNKHVVSDASADYTVITNDGQEHKAKVLALDPVNDIAVIKIDGNSYPTLNFGDSTALKTGQTVVAIGNSLGEFSNTVSRGIISGLKRSVTAGSELGGDSERLTNIIQTDAAINPGNSGGPLLDINSNVIGINVAMAQGAQNIGFAIPSNQIKKIVDQVRMTGKISTPYIGVRYIPVDSTIQKQNNLPNDYGALVVRGQSVTDLAVVPGSPADKAGIVENDIILEINGTKIDDKNGLSDIIGQYNVGDTLTLKVWHKGEQKDLQVKLEERK